MRAQPCLTLCVPIDCSPLGSSFHGILQARIMEWFPNSFSRRSCFWPKDQTLVRYVSCIGQWFFTTSVSWETLFIFFSVQFICSVVSDSWWPYGLQHARLPCPSPTPGACSNSCPLSWWCHPTISASVIHFSSCLQSFPASGSFPVSQFFTSGGQSTGVSASASVLPMNIQDWFPLKLTSWISLLSKGLSRVFSNTTVQKHQSFSAELSL